MHIKFLKHGTGSGKEAAKYVLETSKSFSKEVLDGNPEMFSAVTDSLDFVHRYRSAVITWAREDEPTPEQIRATLDKFYDVAFAGLDRDRFSPLAVLHTGEDGRKDMHVLIPRVDLETGLSYNPAPPGWQRLYDPVRDMMNYQHDWTRPDDEQRKRIVNTKAPERIDRKDGKQQITQWLNNRINAGMVNSRDDIVSSLSEIGEVTRQTKNAISIQLPDFNKPLRLTGGIYEQQFDANIIRETQGKEQRRCGVDEQEQLKRYLISQREFSKVIERVSNFNRKKYAKTEPAISAGTPEIEQPTHAPTVTPDLDNHRPSVNDVRRNLGANSLPDQQDHLQLSSDRSERARDTEASKQVSRSFGEDTGSRADTTTTEKEEVNDTTRNTIDAIIATAHRLAREAKFIAERTVNWLHDHFERRAETTRNLATASNEFNRSGAEIGAIITGFRQAIKHDYLERKSISQQVRQLEQLEFEQKTKNKSYDMDM
jgi:hypothetical protein